MCHESMDGLGETIGIGKGTVSLQDFDEADAIFVIGQNPGTNHPRMLTALEEAKENGATIVSINPLLERGLERFAHPQKPRLNERRHLRTLLQVRINGDVALLKGMMKRIFEREDAPVRLSTAHSSTNTPKGLMSFGKPSMTCPGLTSWSKAGSSRKRSRRPGTSTAMRTTIVCWAMGLTQHKNGVANIQEVVNLLLLRGNFGRPGAGACPVRGHSNVQGDRTVGIVERPSEALLDRLQEVFKFDPPRNHGVDVVESIHAMNEGRGKVFIGMGGNFVAATPDTHYTEAASADAG